MKGLAGPLLIAGGALLIVAGAGGQPAETSKEWPTYGHDPGGMRFSPLTQITPENVGRLKVAWVYHMRPAGAIPPAGRPPAAAEGKTPEPAPGGRGRGGRRGPGVPPRATRPHLTPL